MYGNEFNFNFFYTVLESFQFVLNNVNMNRISTGQICYNKNIQNCTCTFSLSVETTRDLFCSFSSTLDLAGMFGRLCLLSFSSSLGSNLRLYCLTAAILSTESAEGRLSGSLSRSFLIKRLKVDP